MRGQKTTTLKGVFRVSKNSDVPIGKDANARPMRMTRSRSAALATVAEEEVVEKPVTRKRKLTEDPAAPTLPAPKKQQLARTEPATPRKKRPTTLSAYFSPSKPEQASVALMKPVIPATVVEPVIETVAEPVIETVVEPVAEPKIAEAVVETVVAPKLVEAAATTLPDNCDKLNERAAVLLARLRNRTKVTSETTAEETRSIQDDLRTRRTATTLPRSAPAPAPSKFAEAGGITASEQHARDIHRQFVSITRGTALPQGLRKLNEIFQALDHTVMFGGQTSVIYHRARHGVEAMAKRTFGWRELGQILALYPESYTYKPMPTVHDGRRIVSVELSPKVRGMDLAVEIEARRDEFGRRLVALVDTAHRAFLVQRGYEDKDIDATQGQWHPSFDVESTPAVTPLPLPPTPAAAAGPVATFDRERLRHLLGAAEAKNSELKDKPPAVLALPTPADSPLLQPVAVPKESRVSTAKNLLERIREKQRAKEAAQLAAVQAVPQATRTMHSRLPAILETLSFLFYTERRNVLPYFYVVDKLVESKGLERPDISNHIIAIAGFVPEWCSITEPSANDSGGTTTEPSDSATTKLAPVEPSPDARLAITRTISMREAKARLIAKIEAVV
ncbi:hypothetical protein GGI19_000113 [Coemansia pectinata]|uniref:CDT1 Geminin-binding domain-containing protein n=1 Tax=Coemansia pectinata TaxID=1052879 RepID=A0A9W8H7B6_9FUNG|nr:hypothetical protein GGI19_000113 [Coemansia pectinata]